MPSRSIVEIRARLYEAAAQPDGDIAAGALWIAAEEYADLDVASYLRILDDLAATVRRGAPSLSSPGSLRPAITAELFHRQGFAGNADEYYDPRNSYLNEVLDRRRGIPITLAIVYLGVASRLGQPVQGINAPGHFLVRHGDVILDPFNAGAVVTEAAFTAQLRQLNVSDPDGSVAELLAAPPDTRAILTRVLGNLKANYLHRGDLQRALAVVDRLVALNPDNPAWLRDRGALYQRLDCPRAAITDLERYLALVPDDPEIDVIRNAVVQLHRHAPTLH
jgi:regulator of sirC expression with transglutaminase-like and TPR domain